MKDRESGPMTRYSLVLPEGLFDRVKEVAEKRDTTVAAVLRKFILLGLEYERSIERGGELVIKEGEKEKILLII